MTDKNSDITITFWGVRGSIPTPGRKYQKYGGNTSCIEVRCGKHILIFDGGTGLKNLGIALAREFDQKNGKLALFFSHTHWDHIQGFPFFAPLYMKNMEISVYGGHFYSDIRTLLDYQMHREFFPVALQDLPAQISYHDLGEDPFKIGAVKLFYKHLMHPTLSIGFRIEYKGKTVVYATDNELVSEAEIPCFNAKNMELLIKDADILIADGQYTNSEYQNRKGWGHSPIESVVDISKKFGVKQLYLFHHDPFHDDKKVDEMIKTGQSLASSSLKVFGAKEGQVITC